MRRAVGLLVLGVALIAGRAVRSVALETPEFPFGVDGSPAAIQTAATRIVNDYVDAVGGIAGTVHDAPTVAVRNTPNLAAFDPRNNEIVLAHWPTVDEASRGFFLALAESEEDAEALFVELFNWFLVAHEMTHWFQRTVGMCLDRYGSEAMANDAAVAFFMRDGIAETRLLRLRERIVLALTRLEDPTPAGWEEAAFFNAHYAELARDPSRYGYYQFRLIREAVDRRGDLDFEALIRAASAGSD